RPDKAASELGSVGPQAYTEKGNQQAPPPPILPLNRVRSRTGLPPTPRGTRSEGTMFAGCLTGPDRAHMRRLLDVLPAAAYTCDADGLITYFNHRAVEVWGREPRLNDPVDRY